MIIEDIVKEIQLLLDYVSFHYGQNSSFLPYDINQPPQREFGNFSTNIAFILSKRLKKAPKLIADEITQKIIPAYPSWNQLVYVESTSSQSPGFINFFIKNKVLWREFMKKASGNDDLIEPRVRIDTNDTILIEHTSVNPNKALHVGHLRNAIIGDCLYRIFKKVRKNVRVLNYVDDSGLQVADIIVGFRYAEIPMLDSEDGLSINQKFDHYCGNEVYVKVNKMYDSNPELLEKRRSVLKDLEDPKSNISFYTHNIVKRVLADQLKTSWKLKCRYDLINFESQIVQSKLWDNIFKDLKAKKLISFESDGANKGCWVYKSTSEGEKVLVRSDSTLTYFAKDIPYAIWKLGYINNPFNFTFYSSQWDDTNLYATTFQDNNKIGADTEISKQLKTVLIDFGNISKVITIIDSRQERLQSLISEILANLGIPASKYQYLGYEPVVLSRGSLEMLGISKDTSGSTHMSGRKGIFIEADDAVSILEQKSLLETQKRNPEIPDMEAKKISSAIAVSSIRYFFIKFDFGKMITFDINESLSLDGDTAPYIQYAYARGKKLDEKVKLAGSNSETIESENLDKFDFTPVENDLIWHLCDYTITLKEAAEKSNPKSIAKYLFKLATLFNNFYDKSPILSEKTDYLFRNRVKLLRSSLKVLKDCMDLIGIMALIRM